MMGFRSSKSVSRAAAFPFHIDEAIYLVQTDRKPSEVRRKSRCVLQEVEGIRGYHGAHDFDALLSASRSNYVMNHFQILPS